ncbi:hypothetical protein [Rhodococcus daqingensis]|uniref:GHMP kinase N-terminal domain-containing protein n=1 Tax=Rhodococcus daqingensis TaxID=2479363 RepID=A0ABW2S457_9NOCA
MADLVSQLDAALDLRLVAHFYQKLHGRSPTGIWQAPGALPLLSDDAGAVATATEWGAIVAVEPRDGDTVELRSLNRLAERASVDAASYSPGSGVASNPDWSVEPLAVVWAFREFGYSLGGAAITVQTDLPRGCGPAVPVAAACATGLALRDLLTLDLPDTDLIDLVSVGLQAFSVPLAAPGLVAASLLLDGGEALACDGRSGSRDRLRLNLRDAGLRLLIVDTRVRRHLAEGDLVAMSRIGAGGPSLPGQAAALLHTDDVRGLGPLLTASHAALWQAGWSSPEQDLVVAAALEAGALGARMVVDDSGLPVIALVRIEQVGAVRSAIAHAFRRKGRPPPRSLSTTTATSTARSARRVA